MLYLNTVIYSRRTLLLQQNGVSVVKHSMLTTKKTGFAGTLHFGRHKNSNDVSIEYLT